MQRHDASDIVLQDTPFVFYLLIFDFEKDTLSKQLLFIPNRHQAGENGKRQPGNCKVFFIDGEALSHICRLTIHERTNAT